ncbi:hypothetical protein H1C71_039157, partial [Ictidomys tridecemlineatus]
AKAAVRIVAHGPDQSFSPRAPTRPGSRFSQDLPDSERSEAQHLRGRALAWGSLVVARATAGPAPDLDPALRAADWRYLLLEVGRSSRRTQHLCWYVVLRIEPGLHACQQVSLYVVKTMKQPTERHK